MVGSLFDKFFIVCTAHLCTISARHAFYHLPTGDVSALCDFDSARHAMAAKINAVYGSRPFLDGYIHCGHVSNDHVLIFIEQ